MKIVKNVTAKTSDDRLYKESTRERSQPLWKNIFYLPSEPVWYYAIIVLCYISVLGNLYLSLDGKCKTVNREFKISEMYHIMDVIYLIDIILTIGSKYVPDMKLPDINPSMRPIGVLVLELASLLPIEVVTAIPAIQNDNIYCILRLNRCIKIIRIFYFYRHQHNMVDSKLLMRIVEMFSSMIFITMITYSLYCTIQCHIVNCVGDNKCLGYETVIMVTSKITTSGFAQFPKYQLNWELTSTISELTVFFFVITFAMAYMTIGLTNLYLHQVAHIYEYNIVVAILKRYHVPAYLVANTIEFYNILWQKRGGYNDDTRFLLKLPPAMHNEIMIDISWPAFKHSKLFQVMELPFLRYVARFMQQTFMLPGDFVYKKNEWKTKMVYIVSGSVHLLSEEDEDSPILSLCGGTCIGESCLIYSYKSINTVRCKTFCVFHILEKKDFIKSFHKYPAEYNTLQNAIRDRYQRAHLMNDLSQKAKSKMYGIQRHVDIYSMLWVKNTLHRLMAKDPESSYRHEFQNIYLINEINENDFNKLIFTAKFLDLLVIEERIEVDTDTVFIHAAFPCILQPNSVIVIIWEMLIILLTIFLSFVTPYFSFITEETPNWYNRTVTVITIFFWFDIYVQLSTGVKTKHGMSTKIKTIATARMQSLGFWADLFSCVPCEIFSSIILRQLTSQNRACMHINRLFKLWRVERVFRLWESTFNANVIFIRYVKFSWINLYTIFIFYCKLYNLHLSDDHTLLFMAVQIMTNIGIIDADFHPNDVIFVLTDVASSFINLLMYAHIASAYILTDRDLIEMQKLCYDVVNVLNSKKLEPHYSIRVKEYMYTQWDENGGVRMKYPHRMFCNMYPNIYSEITECIAGDILLSLTFFENSSSDFILDVCSLAKIRTFPPDEVVIRSGDITKNVYIFFQGTCQLIEGGGKTRAISGRIVPINLLEGALDAPSVNTYVTKTHCKFVVLSYSELVRKLNKYPDESRVLKVIANSSDLRYKLIALAKADSETVVTRIKKQTNQSFFKFDFNMKKDSFEEYDYYIPFDRLYPFSFVRRFLMHRTISPNGWFIYYWECQRCVCAVLTSIVYFTFPLMNTRYRPLFYILDGFAVLDIYVRLHVCYYDDNGLLVKHPLKTASHYFQHGFLIDLLAVLPTGQFVSSKDHVIYFILHLNRLLQMHRYFNFFSCLFKNSMVPMTKAYCLIYIPILLVLSNLSGSFMINSECSFHRTIAYSNTELFLQGIYCSANAMLVVSNFTRPIGPIRGHLYGVYIATSFLTTVGMQGFQLKSFNARDTTNVLCIVGLYLTVVIAGRILAFYSIGYETLQDYQDEMCTMNKYFDAVGVSPNLKKTIVNRYELKWRRLKGKNIHRLMTPFNESLKLDILYALYGRELYESSVFAAKTKTFYRNLLPHMKHDVIIKGGYMETINDISDSLIFLYKGNADVLAADGIKLATLQPGSIFGNLENMSKTRIPVSIVAAIHVETLSIPSIEFHKVLEYSPDIGKQYRLLKAKYISYIPSQVISEEKVVASHIRMSDRQKKMLLLYAYDPNCKSMQIWNAVAVIISCYFEIFLDLYQLGSGEFSMYIIVLLYSSDILYIIQYLVKNRTAYEDEEGNLVKDLNLIKQHHQKSRWKIWISLLSMIPLDVGVLVFPIEKNIKNKLFGYLRLNRLLRLTFIFEYFASTIKKLNVNVYLVRFGYIVVWSSLVVNGVACLIAVFSCSFEVNMEPTIPPCKVVASMSSLEKFKLYVRFLYIAVDCFTFTSQHTYYPQGEWHIILFIVIMLTCHNLYIVCLGQVFQVLNECNNMKFIFERFIHRLAHFMQREDVSISLMDKILNYLELIWIQQHGSAYPQLLDEAPLYLQDAILNDAFAHLIIDHPIFAKCHSDCLRQIVQKMRTTTYFSGNYIQFKGAIDECMYFIFQGEVIVVYDEYVYKDDVVQVLNSGDTFGVLQGLYHRTPHLYSYRATKRTIIIALNLNTWEYLLKFFPASKEQIYQAAEEYNGL